MLSTRVTAAFLLVAACLLQAGPSAQQQGRQQQGQPAQPQQTPPPAADQPVRDPQIPTPTFRGGTSFVRVDVIVTDGKAQPITDLTQADFEVLEDGKPQSIEQFRLVKVDGNPPPGAPPPRELRTRADEELEAGRDDVRVFVIFLDDYHVRRGSSMTVRQPLTNFIRKQLRPNDLVAVMMPLTPVTDLEFTRNHESIITAVERFEGRKFDYTPRNRMEESYSRYPTDVVERIRNDVVMSALQGLSVRLGSLREGRKSVIFVSEGFTAMLPPQMRRQDASMPADPRQVRAGAAQADSTQQMTAEWFGQSDVYSRMRDIFDAANRNNTAIYSLDPRGLAPFEYDINDFGVGGGVASFATDSRALQMTQDTLRTLSEETDGRAIVNRNTLEQGLAQIVRDSSFYYLLGYTSTQAPNDGKFHEITVRVKRRNAEVRARKGYWAMTAADAIRAANPTPDLAKPIQQALATIAPSVQSGKYVRTWVGTERAENGKTRVTLIWEPLPQAAAARREQPGRLAVLAANASGDLVYRGGTPETAPAAVTGPQKLTFDASPGKLELRMTVEGANGAGTLDSEIRTIDVPDLTTPEARMSTPRVFRARTARDFQALAADANAVPVAGREFSRTERLLIRFDAYGGGNQPAVTAALMNRSGQKMSDVPVAVAPIGGTHQIDMGLASVPPGEYLVEITVKGASGEVSELVPLRITS